VKGLLCFASYQDNAWPHQIMTHLESVATFIFVLFKFFLLGMNLIKRLPPRACPLAPEFSTTDFFSVRIPTTIAPRR
jgi:hypothetical protein